MARKLRVEYPGAIYHVMNRGDRRELIFHDDTDRRRFLETLGQVCVRTGWQVHAYCLMPNHFHLVMETPEANLVAGMKWLLGTYTGRFNRRHKVFGHLFSGRYKSLIIDGSGTGYLKTVCDYVHLNPSRSKLLSGKQSLRTYPWSSWQLYLAKSKKRSAWLRVDRVMGEWGIPRDSAAGRRQLERQLEERREAEQTADYKGIRRGWCLGEKEFKKELLAQMSERLGREHYGEERRESQAEKAERIIGEELRRRRWTEATLATRAKCDPEKVKVAVRLRKETMMTVAEIAHRMSMGSVANVNTLLYHWRKDHN